MDGDAVQRRGERCWPTKLRLSKRLSTRWPSTTNFASGTSRLCIARAVGGKRCRAAVDRDSMSRLFGAVFGPPVVKRSCAAEDSRSRLLARAAAGRAPTAVHRSRCPCVSGIADKPGRTTRALSASPWGVQHLRALEPASCCAACDELAAISEGTRGTQRRFATPRARARLRPSWHEWMREAGLQTRIDKVTAMSSAGSKTGSRRRASADRGSQLGHESRRRTCTNGRSGVLAGIALGREPRRLRFRSSSEVRGLGRRGGTALTAP